jgi:signal transduction histidine kinase
LQTTDLSRHQRELVHSISLATTATTEMLNTLLDYSRIEAGVD